MCLLTMFWLVGCARRRRRGVRRRSCVRNLQLLMPFSFFRVVLFLHQLSHDLSSGMVFAMLKRPFFSYRHQLWRFEFGFLISYRHWYHFFICLLYWMAAVFFWVCTLFLICEMCSVNFLSLCLFSSAFCYLRCAGFLPIVWLLFQCFTDFTIYMLIALINWF